MYIMYDVFVYDVFTAAHHGYMICHIILIGHVRVHLSLKAVQYTFNPGDIIIDKNQC